MDTYNSHLSTTTPHKIIPSQEAHQLLGVIEVFPNQYLYAFY